MALREREHVERLTVTGARVADLAREPLDGLEILREHVHAGVDDGRDVGKLAGEIRRQRLDGRLRAAGLDRADAIGVMARAAVGQVVAIDGRQHDVAKAHELDGARRVRDFVGIEPAVRVAGVDCAELARARAHRAHQHDRRSAVVPALADVRADRFLADRREPMLAHRRTQPLEALAGRHAGLQPRRLRLARRLLTVRASLHAVLDGGETLLGLVLRTRRHDRDAAELGHRAW